MAENLLVGVKEEELSNTMAPSVRSAVETLDQYGTDWNEIGAILAATPTLGLALKGGTDWRTDLWQAVKEEVAQFLCSETEKYGDLRNDWTELRERSVPIAVASLSGAIGSYIGIAGGIIAPLVVWLLISASRIGVEAFCQTVKSEPSSSSGASD
jgi:hypothetical protein